MIIITLMTDEMFILYWPNCFLRACPFFRLLLSTFCTLVLRAKSGLPDLRAAVSVMGAVHIKRLNTKASGNGVLTMWMHGCSLLRCSLSDKDVRAHSTPDSGCYDSSTLSSQADLEG